MRQKQNDIRPEDVQGRADTQRLLPADPERALTIARAIRHPWYRCQAISFVAEVQRSRPVALRLLIESLAAAHELSEPNRIVSVAAWPLRQLVQLAPDIALAEVSRLLPILAKESHGLRRLDGLTRLLGAVASVTELRERIKPVFIETAAVSHGWRTERLVAFAASYVAAFDPFFARSLLASRTPNRFAKHAAAELFSDLDADID